mmetsp:Transcript_9093/g.27237  ORF Transcript_9093/g.27237 Transcript_9093/m.27237 type:complete len:226 (-) Transcript_9093:71-748(-)|eukprot:CAMPEP_0119275194 /NCGR_PEP_ID=MMETSP1329-20130426/13398_1 /TAXON_ID=114041 /ORGANISM="Genus nov. species nov., Strain RCC1024" /LENGTH=225 /DNA_ID=CAMNT_0007275561 /DNA_START=177 /DNA_END=854 /DNA_ORIENTATION=+
MRSVAAISVALAIGASGFVARQYPRTMQPWRHCTKKDSDAAPVEINALGKGSIVEFVHNKHTTLGVVTDHMVKSKGGLRYEITTADEKVHVGVAPRDIHFSAPPLKGDKGDKPPLKRLPEFEHVLQTSATNLIDPETLEISWEIAAEEDKVLRTKDISKLTDMGSSPVDIYRTFRVLSSELGHVFFKGAKGEAAAFKARAKKTVEAAKQSLCNNHSDEYGEFCLV